MAKAKSTTKKPAKPAEKEHGVAATKKPLNLSKELVLGSLFAELLGTFALATFALSYMTLLGAGNPLYVIFAAIAIYLVFWRLSGAHLNPAITLGLLAIRKITVVRAAGYIVAQVLGAMIAYVIVSQFVQAIPSNPDSLQPSPTLYSINLVEGDTWRPFFGEALGAFLFAVGFAAAFLGRRSDAESSLAIGGMYYVGLFVASLASASLLNPALGFALGAYHTDNLWTILQYALGPIVGGILGFLAFRLLKWDIGLSEGRERA